VTPRHVTKEALLCYIRVDAEPCYIRKVERYMRDTLGTQPGTTREALRRLVKAGEVVRTERGYYRGA